MSFKKRKEERTKKYFDENYKMKLRNCSACSGSGKYCGRPCGACNGTGKERYRDESDKES